MRALFFLPFLILFAGMAAHAQTNDPRISQQYYIGAHNIDQLWNITTGSSNTRIAIHSATGFTSSHEDMAGSRYLNPFTNWFAPDNGFARFRKSCSSCPILNILVLNPKPSHQPTA